MVSRSPEFGEIVFSTKTGIERFVKIHTFSPLDSETIRSGLKNRRLYFTDVGDLFVTDQSGTRLFSYRVGIVGNTNNSFPVEGNLVHQNTDSDRVFYSRDLGLWVLCLESNGSYSVRYNPVPREEMVDFYKTNRVNALNVLYQYCGETRGKDPICPCLNQENSALNISTEEERNQFCMNTLLGSNSTRSNIKRLSGVEYSGIEGQCACLNSKCLKNHPLQKQIEKDRPCLGTILSICNTNISAGGNISTLGLEIEQKCGVNAPTGGSTPTPTGGSTTGGTTTQPTPPTPPTPPGESTTVKNPPLDEESKNQNTTLFIAILVIILCCLSAMAGIFFMMRNK